MSTILRVVSHLAAALLLTLPLACSGHSDTCCTETVSRTTVQGECCKKECCPRCGKECCRHCGQCPCCCGGGKDVLEKLVLRYDVLGTDQNLHRIVSLGSFSRLEDAKARARVRGGENSGYTDIKIIPVLSRQQMKGCCLDDPCAEANQTWFNLLATNQRDGGLVVLGGFSSMEDARTAMRTYGGDSSYRNLHVVRVRAIPTGKECCSKPDLKDGKCRCTACECGTTGKCTCTSGGKRLKDPCVCKCGCLSTGKCICTPDKAR